MMARKKKKEKFRRSIPRRVKPEEGTTTSSSNNGKFFERWNVKQDQPLLVKEGGLMVSVTGLTVMCGDLRPVCLVTPTISMTAENVKTAEKIAAVPEMIALLKLFMEETCTRGGQAYDLPNQATADLGKALLTRLGETWP